MEFGALKIDLTALAALVTALGTVYAAYKGREQNKNVKRKQNNEKSE